MIPMNTFKNMLEYIFYDLELPLLQTQMVC